jgi:hypothetical protein
MAANDFLKTEHPVYEANKVRWLTLERRLRGGHAVLDELTAFDWETGLKASHLDDRKKQALYFNFADIFVRVVGGHLMRQAPPPDSKLQFGNLGVVERSNRSAPPSQAELVYYNTDGVGMDGSQWNPFWSTALGKSSACGFRWVMCESPAVQPVTGQDEINGQRPYLLSLSPLSVTNWNFVDGQLEFAILRTTVRTPKLDEKGAMTGNKPVPRYLLMTRQGFEGFGIQFAGGGWWHFTAEGVQDTTSFGDWTSTGGLIPLWQLFWERDEGDEEKPEIARSGIFDLTQLAISYMNLSSAADYDAWDSAASLRFVLGASEAAFNLMASKILEGSKYVPVPSEADRPAPTITDSSAGAVAAEVFNSIFERKRSEARELAARESSGSPDASGASKDAGFVDIKAPILTRLASELETAQNTAIFFLEKRFGYPNPMGYVQWPREFDLEPLIDDIEEQLQLEIRTGYHSPTLASRLMVDSARERRLIKDAADGDVIEKEYMDAVTKSLAQKDAQANALASAGIVE